MYKRLVLNPLGVEGAAFGGRAPHLDQPATCHLVRKVGEDLEARWFWRASTTFVSTSTWGAKWKRISSWWTKQASCTKAGLKALHHQMVANKKGQSQK